MHDCMVVVLVLCCSEAAAAGQGVRESPHENKLDHSTDWVPPLPTYLDPKAPSSSTLDQTFQKCMSVAASRCCVPLPVIPAWAASKFLLDALWLRPWCGRVWAPGFSFRAFYILAKSSEPPPCFLTVRWSRPCLWRFVASLCQRHTLLICSLSSTSVSSRQNKQLKHIKVSLLQSCRYLCAIVFSAAFHLSVCSVGRTCSFFCPFHTGSSKGWALASLIWPLGSRSTDS